MSVVSTETCNKTSSCYVISQGGYVSLIKLMHGIKSQSRMLKRGSSPLKSPLRMKCDNFIISCCRKGQLKWIHDSYIQEQELNGSVTIKASGLYGLYNTLSFENGHHHNTNKLEVLHQVRLDKSLGHQSKVLLERNITLFAQNRSYDTSDFFDFVFLRKGDRVYPTISNTSFLNSMSGANMWGVFQVTLDPRLIWQKNTAVLERRSQYHLLLLLNWFCIKTGKNVYVHIHITLNQLCLPNKLSIHHSINTNF